MKKKISALFLSAMVVASTISPYTTVYAAEEAHEHTYTKETIAATCDTDGYTLYTCEEDGDSYKDDIVGALGHDYGYVNQGDGTHKAVCKHDASHNFVAGHEWAFQNKVAATCDDEGYSLYKCTLCGAEEKRDYSPALGHDYTWIDNNDGTHTGICNRNHNHKVTEFCEQYYKEIVTPPTCVDKGYTSHICGKCGYVKVDTYVDPNGHNYIYTNNGDGTHTGICSEDGSSVTKAHDYKTTTIKPTCTAVGYDLHECQQCGYSYKDDYVPAIGHDYAYTSNSNGTHTGICRNDSRHVVTDNCVYTDKLVPATGDDQGYTLHTCTICGYSYKTNFTPALGHEKTYTSTNDGFHNVVSADDPDNVKKEACEYEKTVVPATCEEAGYTLNQCKDCGYSTKTDYTEPLGHKWKWTSLKDGRHHGECERDDTHTTDEPCNYSVVVTPPTCDTNGYTTHTCTVCGYTYTDSIVPMLGHDYNYKDLGNGTHRVTCNNDPTEVNRIDQCVYTDKVINPTCTEAGYTRHECQLCGYYYDDSEVPALGHDYKWTNYDNNTHKGVCQRDPSHVTYVKHEMINSITAPTHTEQGYTTHTCPICGHSHKDTFVPAGGHTYEWVYDYDHGTMTQVCSVDGAKGITQEIPVTTDYYALLPKLVTTKKTSQTVKWKAIKGAKSYTVYYRVCDGGEYKAYKTVTGTKLKMRGLKKGQSYKYYVVANGVPSTTKMLTQATSYSVHGVTTGGKNANPSKITVSKKKVTLKKGKKVTVTATVKSKAAVRQHVKVVRYYSSDKKVAKVSKKGVIKGVGKGVCKIYAVTQNGLYKAITVKVK